MATKIMPAVGLGCWKIPKDACQALVYSAIKEAGVRHLDCACDYGNEKEVGLGIKQAISEGVVSRDDLFITSKLWCTYHAPEHVDMACKRSLSDLGLTHLDLYLIHFPISLKFVPFETKYPPEWINEADNKIVPVLEPLQGTWTAMEKLVNDGLTKFIGVSNFNYQLLQDLLGYCKIPPYANQVELHPYLTQQHLVDYCKSKNIKVTALSPLGASSYKELGMATNNGALEEGVVTQIAAVNRKTPAQIVLRWNIQRGVDVIPKSSSLKRIQENMSVFDFTLSPEEMNDISALNCNRRYNDPGVFCKGMAGTDSPALPIYA